MAIFFEYEALTESQIQKYCKHIEIEESAENVTFINETDAFLHFEGSISGQPVKFNFDRMTKVTVIDYEY